MKEKQRQCLEAGQAIQGLCGGLPVGADLV